MELKIGQHSLEVGPLAKSAKDINREVHLIDPKSKELNYVRLPLVEAIVKLNARNWAPKLPEKQAQLLSGNREQIRSRLETFPQGQLGVFLKRDRKKVLVATLHTLRVNSIASTYAAATGNLTFRNHNPKGRILLCVSIVGDAALKRFKQFKDLRVAQILLTYGSVLGARNGLRVRTFTRKIPGAINLHERESAFKPRARRRGERPKANPVDKAAKGNYLIFEYHERDFNHWKGTEKASKELVKELRKESLLLMIKKMLPLIKPVAKKPKKPAKKPAPKKPRRRRFLF